MALAEFVKFKHGLYKSCGIERYEGIMLEPCLLQPCFHVAGLWAQGCVCVWVWLVPAAFPTGPQRSDPLIYVCVYIYIYIYI